MRRTTKRQMDRMQMPISGKPAVRTRLNTTLQLAVTASELNKLHRKRKERGIRENQPLK